MSAYEIDNAAYFEAIVDLRRFFGKQPPDKQQAMDDILTRLDEVYIAMRDRSNELVPWSIVLIEHDTEPTVTSRMKVTNGWLYRVTKAGTIALQFVPEDPVYHVEIKSPEIIT